MSDAERQDKYVVLKAADWEDVDSALQNSGFPPLGHAHREVGVPVEDVTVWPEGARCATCRWWADRCCVLAREDSDYMDDVDAAERIDAEDRLARAFDGEGRADLLTSAEFGCVQWTADTRGVS